MASMICTQRYGIVGGGMILPQILIVWLNIKLPRTRAVRHFDTNRLLRKNHIRFSFPSRPQHRLQPRCSLGFLICIEKKHPVDLCMVHLGADYEYSCGQVGENKTNLNSKRGK